MSGLHETLTGWLSRESRRYLCCAIPPEHVEGATDPGVSLEAGRHYFRLWLSEMCLRRDREWFKSWHPAVHSLVRFRFGTQSVDIPYVAGLQQLPGVEASGLDRVIQLNYPLTTLMPFNGGVVEINAGLLALQGADYIARFLKVMGDFAGLLAAPQLSAALQVAAPLASGVQELFGASDGRLHLGLHQAYSAAGGDGANELRSGYLLAALADEGQLAPERLWVRAGRLRYGCSQLDGQPLSGHSYMLFRIESRTERDDWDSLDFIQKPFQAALEALGMGERERAESQIRQATANALQSPDLTRTDRRRVAQAIKDEYDNAREMGLAASRDSTTTLGQVMRSAMSVDRAAALGELRLEDLFASG
jgi:hypothetical protein